MDSDRDLKDLIKEAADMEDAKYEESFSLNLEDQEQSDNYQITNGDQEAQEGPVLSQKRQGKSRETPAEQAVICKKLRQFGAGGIKLIKRFEFKQRYITRPCVYCCSQNGAS